MTATLPAELGPGQSAMDPWLDPMTRGLVADDDFDDGDFDEDDFDDDFDDDFEEEDDFDDDLPEDLDEDDLRYV